ncbi:MAG: ATP-binding cassette domain-containing protein [Bacteroidaceae bacterium]|nr:ATP-binding cassette domain-containing protein [Bacteroidaceae bacterium]
MNIINISQGVCRKPEWRMAEPVDFNLSAGEHIAIVGPNGAGKSMLVDIITSAHPLLMRDVEYGFDGLASDNIKYITFKDSYGDSDANYYLQQRWNQYDIDKETPTVGEQLEMAYALTGDDTEERRTFRDHLYEMFHLEPLLDKYVVMISSGELRKLQLTKVLLTNPKVLIMDNPFVGLDKNTREQLRSLLLMLSAPLPPKGEDNHSSRLQIILVLSREDEIPDFITHVVPVRDMKVYPKVEREAFITSLPSVSPKGEPIAFPLASASHSPAQSATVFGATAPNSPSPVVKLNNVAIRYGERTILKELSLTINQGERWALSGENGAGKSTLLSLVCADNPQGYACDIELFGKKRGTGETIWDIKRHIGYVSPEMHRAYHYNVPAIRIVASGLKDSIGLYVRPTEEEYEVCREWMKVFRVEQFADRPFLSLSSGEQRLILLARAFVKSPDLLILDEPLHGLDTIRRREVRDIINRYSLLPGKTLIMVTHYEEELPESITHKIYLKRQ